LHSWDLSHGEQNQIPITQVPMIGFALQSFEYVSLAKRTKNLKSDKSILLGENITLHLES